MTSVGDPRATLWLVTGDLFLGSRLRGVGESAGYRVVPSPRLERLAESFGEVDRVLIDLASPGIDLHQLPPSIPLERVAGYAPHVRVDLLKVARSVGLSAVFTRGQLELELPRWLAR
jgi:hypothetical protein